VGLTAGLNVLEKKQTLTPTRIKTQDRPASSLVTIPTMLTRLSTVSKLTKIPNNVSRTTKWKQQKALDMRIKVI
jgi:hypothetical protein